MPILSSDAFTGTNGTALPTYAAGRWATAPSDSDLAIQTNTAGSGFTTESGAVNIETAWPINCYTQATVVTVTDRSQLVTVRHSTSVYKQFYGAGHTQNEVLNKRYRIIKYDNGVFTELVAHGSQVMTIGDVVRLTILDLTLTLTVNGIDILTVADGVLVLWTGNSGLYASHSVAGVQIWDAYEAGTPDSDEPTNSSILSGSEKVWD